MHTIKYAELVDVTDLQKLMDSLNRVIGIANAVIDTDGIVITSSGWQDTCLKFHRINPHTCANCIESDTSLAKSMLKGEGFAIYNCLNGLVDAAMPIIVADEHVANVFTGQCFTDAPNLDFFRCQGQRFQFDESAYLEAVARVPIVSKTHLETITQMYAELAQTLATQGLNRLRQMQTSAELERLNNELSQRVTIRTRELSDKNQLLLQEKQALADSEARLTALFENMSSGVAVYLPCADGQDFIFTGFNRAAERIEQIARQAVLGQKLTAIFPGAAAFGLVSALKRVAETGQAEAFPAAFYQDGRIQGWRDSYIYRLPSGEIVTIYDDITERQQREAIRQELEARFRSTFNAAAIGMAVISTEGLFIQVNASLCRIIGYSENALQHLSIKDLSHPADWQTDLTMVAELLAGTRDSYQAEKRYLHQHGQPIWILQAVSAVRDDSGTVLYFIAQIQDISERKRLVEQLERQAHLDYLTGIANRRFFMENAERELARAQRYQSLLSVFMLDIDHFKVINDRHGHAVGDKVLQKLSWIFSEALRENDLPGRLGGEEFAVLLPETDYDKSQEVAERLRNLIAATCVTLESVTLHFTVSIGIATLESPADSIDALLNRADKALYRAKQLGRNRVVAFR